MGRAILRLTLNYQDLQVIRLISSNEVRGRLIAAHFPAGFPTAPAIPCARRPRGSAPGAAEPEPTLGLPTTALSIQLSDERSAGSALLVIDLPPSQLDRAAVAESQGVK